MSDYPFVYSLELSVRIVNALVKAGCTTRESFLSYTELDFIRLRNIGRLSVAALLAEQRRLAGITPESAVADTKRAEDITFAIVNVLKERAQGMPIVTLVGCLRLIEHSLLNGNAGPPSMRDNADFIGRNMERETMERVCELPNGNMLYREPNEAGGHRYWSDEIGGGVVVWDTCLVDIDTLLAAITEEHRRLAAERRGRK